MKLYEIDALILRALDEFVDPETGEISGDAAELQSRLDALQMQKAGILEYLAKLTLNKRSEIAGIKAEEQRLADRRKRLEREEARLMEVLDRECAGEKTDLGVATVSYRKGKSTIVEDEAQAIEWLEKNGFDDCVKYAAPAIRKSDVKDLILKQGKTVPGVHIEDRRNMSLN